MALFKKNHGKVITGKLKNIKHKLFLETPKVQKTQGASIEYDYSTGSWRLSYNCLL